MRRIALILSIICTATFISCDEQIDKGDRTIESIDAAIKIVSPKDVYNAMQEDSSMQLVDVRTEEEYDVTHLKSSQNICVTTPGFEKMAAKLDKNKPVYVYCKKGGRSAKASLILAEMGFTQIYDLQGGITNWEDQEMETVKG